MPDKVELETNVGESLVDTADSEVRDGHSFSPFVPAGVTLRELTPLALIFGVSLGVILGAASLYLLLKVGLTITSGIVIAAVSITVFKSLSRLGLRNPSILEHNIAQSAGSAGESVAFVMGATIPAILLLGVDLKITYSILVSLIGGVLGILLVIPMRRQLVVKMHRELKYPEGLACAKIAETLVEKGGKTFFFGFGVSFVYFLLMQTFKGWREIASKEFGAPFRKALVSLELSPVLLGAGYIIGPRTASTMCAGGVMASLVFYPLINYFGGGMTYELSPGSVPIPTMSPYQLHSYYVTYIGIGALLAAGVISVFRLILPIKKSFAADLVNLERKQDERHHSNQDISMKSIVIAVLLLLIASITFRPLGLQWNLLAAVMIVGFGFVYVSVSARLTGELGSSAAPVAGLTIGALMLVCLTFLLLGWSDETQFLGALSIGVIIGTAVSTGSTTSQVLKTGFFLGATPRYQQIALLVGVIASVLILGPILSMLNQAGTVYVPARLVVDGSEITVFSPGLHADPTQLGAYEKLHGIQGRSDASSYRVWRKEVSSPDGPAGRYLVNDQGVAAYLVDPGINGQFASRPDGSKVQKFWSPKAIIMAFIIKGVWSRQFPWQLVLLGVTIALLAEMCGIRSLVFAVGLYLPLFSSLPILIGGIIRWLVDYRHRLSSERTDLRTIEESDDESPGIVMASGYIVGGAISAIIIAFIVGGGEGLNSRIEAWAKIHNPFFEGPNSDCLSLLPFALVAILLYLIANGRLFSNEKRRTQ